MKKTIVSAVGLMLLFASPALAEEIVIKMQQATEQGSGQELGTVTASSTPYGTVFTPELSGLTPGLHGFHLHTNPSCAPQEQEGKMVPALAAGGHYDPANSKKHGQPWGDGHLGDLPALYVDENGKATNPLLAPRVKLADLKGRSLMIHVSGDNYSDQPKPLGGGGARMACGVIR